MILGQHLILEYYDCDCEIINDADLIEETLCRVAKDAGATIVSSHSNTFEPHGVSAVIIIAESHLTIHTWPEYAYAAVDVFTCGKSIDFRKIVTELQSAFKAKSYEEKTLARGLKASK